MKEIIIRLVLQLILRLILEKTPVVRLLAEVEKAARELENNFARRGYVYRVLKEIEGDAVPTNVLNLAVEIGVVLMKLAGKNDQPDPSTESQA